MVDIGNSEKFLKVSSLLSLLHTRTTKLTFEKSDKMRLRKAAAAAAAHMKMDFENSENFSKANSLLGLLCTRTITLTFEKKMKVKLQQATAAAHMMMDSDISDLEPLKSQLAIHFTIRKDYKADF